MVESSQICSREQKNKEHRNKQTMMTRRQMKKEKKRS